MREHLDVARDLVAALREGGADLPVFDRMDTKNQTMWATAVREAGAGGPFLVRASYPADLSESSVDWARTALGGVPAKQCTIVYGTSSAAEARRLTLRLGCNIVEIPSPLMKHGFGWAVVCDAGCAWSEGVG
jgi:hypothetical protein